MKYHVSVSFRTSCQKIACDEMTSPLRGSTTCRPHRILPAARRPADHRVAHVLGIPVGIFLFGRRVAGDDGILEAGFLEHHLPVLHGLLQIRPPLIGHLMAEIKDDRLDRLGNVRVRRPSSPGDSG